MSREVCKHNKRVEDECPECEQDIYTTHEEKDKEIKELRTRVAELEAIRDSWKHSNSSFFKKNIALGQEIDELQNRLSTVEKELAIARKTHFQREKSLEKRLQLMGEKLKEWQCPNPNKQSIYHEVIYCDECGKPQETDKTFAVEKLESKLSTLLKASEGLEEALEEMIILATPELSMEHKQVEEAKTMLADFRALKEKT